MKQTKILSYDGERDNFTIFAHFRQNYTILNISADIHPFSSQYECDAK